MTRTQRQKVALYALPAEIARFERGTASVASAGRWDDFPEQIPGILWTTDRDLNVTMLQGNGLIYLDSSARRPGRPIEKLFPTQVSCEDPVQAHRFALAGTASSFEFVTSQRTFLAHVEPLVDAVQDLTGTIGVALDVTDSLEKRGARHRRQLQDFQLRKENCLRTLAGGVAHNFNNLLTTILGYASLASLHVPADSPLGEYVRHIEGLAEAAARLSRQLSVFGQRTTPQFDSVNLSQLITSMDYQLRACLSPQVDLRLDLADPLPSLAGDRDHLRSLVLHLVFNASEAIGENPGLVAVRTQSTQVNPAFLRETFMDEELPEGCYIWLQVSDTGCGMDQETKAHLFEPFFSTRFTGRGLGLAMARSMVHAHHGAISVSSKPGLGTTFHVLLPGEASPVGNGRAALP